MGAPAAAAGADRPARIVAAFNKARGHDLERANYLMDLRAANWAGLVRRADGRESGGAGSSPLVEERFHVCVWYSLRSADGDRQLRAGP